MDPGSAATLVAAESKTPKTPTKVNPSTEASQPKPTPYNKGSASRALCNTLGRIADVEDSFRADLDEHASDEPLENFLLFLLSCCTGEEKRDALKEKLDRLMDISLRLCSGETSSERPPPAAEQRPRTMPQGAEEKELDSDIAYGAKVPLRSDWHECLQNYAGASTEATRYAPFIHLTNSILQSLHDGPHRANLKDIRLARQVDDQSYPHIIFQQNDPKYISTEYIGVSGEALAEDVGRKPDVVILSLKDALKTHITQSDSSQPEPAAATWKDQFTSHMAVAPKAPINAPSFPQVKMVLEFKKRTKDGVKKYSPLVPKTCEKKKEPTEVAPQVWAPSRATFQTGFAAEVRSSKNETTHLSSAMHEHRKSSGRLKRPLAEDVPVYSKKEDLQSSKKVKAPKRPFKELPGPIQSAIYAGGKLSSSLAADHTLNAVVEDTVIYLWWYDHGGAVQSHGLNFFLDFPYLVALLAILDYFNEEDWGMNPAFKEIYTDNEISTYNLALEGEGTAGSHIDFCLDFQHGERNSAYSLFGRGTSVLPVTSAASHPLQKAINLKDVKMVAKMYYPETARMDEGGLLKVAHSIAGSELDPDGYVQGHLPLLIASHSWKDRYWKRMNALFDVKKLKRVSRCFRVLVFVKIYPIWELQGDEFVRALFDSLCCHYGLARNGILHRDISAENLMYYRDISGKVVGVLNDFDLAIIDGYLRALSYEQTGTVPFMARELLISIWEGASQPHIYEYDLESYFYVTVWIACSYDGPHLVHKGLFDEWLNAPYYSIVAQAKETVINNSAFNIKPTPGHADIQILLRPFAGEIRRWIRDQVTRKLEINDAMSTISAWKSGRHRVTKAEAVQAEQELVELKAKMRWPQNLKHTQTLFTKIKAVFTQYFERPPEEALPERDISQPILSSATKTSSAERSVDGDGCAQEVIKDGCQHSLAGNSNVEPHQLFTGGNPHKLRLSSEIPSELPAVTAVEGRASIGAAAVTPVLAESAAAREDLAKQARLKKIPISEIMGNEDLARETAKASRAFWLAALNEPTSDWHSLATFLHKALPPLFAPSAPPASESTSVH